MQSAGLRGPQPRRAEARNSLYVRLRPPQAATRNRSMHMRQPIPRQKRFRKEGGRGDGALRIGNLLIASKVPQASDSAQTQGRPRNRFTAAVFRLPFVRTKGNVIKEKGRLAESCGPQPPASGGPLFACAHSRGPRRLLPENFPINDACGSLNRAVRRRPTAADCCRIPTAVGEQRITGCRPNNFAATQRYLRRLAPKARPPQPPKINFTPPRLICSRLWRICPFGKKAAAFLCRFDIKSYLW